MSTLSELSFFFLFVFDSFRVNSFFFSVRIYEYIYACVCCIYLVSGNRNRYIVPDDDNYSYCCLLAPRRRTCICPTQQESIGSDLTKDT